MVDKDRIAWLIGQAGTWMYLHPYQTLVFGYALRYAPVPLARATWATARIMGPAVATLSAELAVIAYESSATIRAVTVMSAVGGLFAGAALVAGVVSGAQTKVLHQHQLIGPEAVTVSSNLGVTRGTRINPIQIGWGSVV